MLKNVFIFLLIFIIQCLVFSSTPPNRLKNNSERTQFYLDVANVIETHHKEITSILNEIGAIHGSTYEIQQSINALRGAPKQELDNLKDIHDLKKLVIYGSSNIPLYTLILQVMIPYPAFEKIVFKMSSKTQAIYKKLWSLIHQNLSEKYDLNSLQLKNLWASFETGKFPSL